MRCLRHGRSYAVYVIGILFVAFALRLWELQARSLWFDEAFEYWSAQVSLTALPETVLTSFQPPLYTAVLHFWLKIALQPFWLRFFSVACSLLTVVGVIALTNRIAGRSAALAAGVIMAVLPVEVRYAQEAAEYALVTCLLTWSLYFLYCSVERPALGFLLAASLLGLLSVYSHYGAAIVVFATTVAVLSETFWRRKWRELQGRVVMATGFLVLGAPLLLFFLPGQL